MTRAPGIDDFDYEDGTLTLDDADLETVVIDPARYEVLARHEQELLALREMVVVLRQRGDELGLESTDRGALSNASMQISVEIEAVKRQVGERQ